MDVTLGVAVAAGGVAVAVLVAPARNAVGEAVAVGVAVAGIAVTVAVAAIPVGVGPVGGVRVGLPSSGEVVQPTRSMRSGRSSSARQSSASGINAACGWRAAGKARHIVRSAGGRAADAPGVGPGPG